MNDFIFYPKLKRRKVEEYYNRLDQFYSDYKKNYEKIAEDCLYRCVYCDVKEIECGGDRFSLDHFRPKQVFADKFNGVLIQGFHIFNVFFRFSDFFVELPVGPSSSSPGHPHLRLGVILEIAALAHSGSCQPSPT